MCVSVCVNLLVKHWSWPDKGWSLLSGDEASHLQHQLQAVRLFYTWYRGRHWSLHRLLGSLMCSCMCVCFAQGQLSERVEAAVHPHSFPSLLWCSEAVSAEVSPGCLLRAWGAVPRWATCTDPHVTWIHFSHSLLNAMIDCFYVWQVLPRHVSRIWGGRFNMAGVCSIPTTWSSKLCWLVYDSVLTWHMDKMSWCDCCFSWGIDVYVWTDVCRDSSKKVIFSCSLTEGFFPSSFQFKIHQRFCAVFDSEDGWSGHTFGFLLLTVSALSESYQAFTSRLKWRSPMQLQ